MNNGSSGKVSSWVMAIGIVVAVVVATAAAMIIIIPMLESNDGGLRISPCQTNMKDMVVAVQMYMGDYDGILPSSALVRHSKKWNKADFMAFGTKLGQCHRLGKQETYVEIIWNYMRSKDAPFCPEDDARATAGPHTQVSYWWKAAVDKAWYGEGCAKTYRKQTDFVYFSDQIILYERAGFHNQNQPLRNGVQINVAYLDSHVKAIAIKNATSGDPKNCAANDDGEPMYFNYDFKRNKGLSSDSVPARYVDPGAYGDRL